MRRDSELPDLLTVEEAAALLRVGRTKAYAMAKEWRATGGLSGLPVLDLGDVLRVPLWRLEAMVGAELHVSSAPAPPPAVVPAASTDEQPAPRRHAASDRTAPGPRRRPSSRRPKTDDRQLTLLHTDDVTNAVDVNGPSPSTEAQ